MTAKNARTLRILERKKGALLDLSLGGERQEGALSLRKGGDIAHDPRRLPFPLPDGCVHTAVVTHVLEYVAPEAIFDWFDELWRVVRPGGIAYLSGPYGGEESHGWVADPQHRTRIVEQTFAWLDPSTPFWELNDAVGRRRPRPWRPLAVARVPGTHGTQGYNVTMVRGEAK